MRAVNLLPVQIAERTPLMKALPLVGAAAVPMVAISLILIGYTGAHSQVSAKSVQLELLRAQVAKLAPVATSPSPSTAGLVDQRTQRRTALNYVLAQEIAWDTTLRDVARVLPANVWLSSLNATSPTPADSAVPASATTPNATGFTISGYAYGESDVALLLSRLQLLPTLSNVTLTTMTKSDLGTRSVVQFDVTAGIQPVRPGVPQ